MADPVPRIQAQLRRRLLAAGALLVGEHKRDLSRSGPPASRPGEFPRAVTYNLRDAPAMVEIPDGVRVGYLVNAAYIVPLVRRGRLGIIDTAERIRPRLLKIIRGA